MDPEDRKAMQGMLDDATQEASGLFITARPRMPGDEARFPSAAPLLLGDTLGQIVTCGDLADLSVLLAVLLESQPTLWLALCMALKERRNALRQRAQAAASN